MAAWPSDGCGFASSFKSLVPKPSAQDSPDVAVDMTRLDTFTRGWVALASSPSWNMEPELSNRVNGAKMQHKCHGKNGRLKEKRVSV